MRYQPVTVSHVTQVPGIASMKRREWLALANDEAKMRTFTNYWQARSVLLGDCGHKHKTEAAAQPCAVRMRKAWHKRRSELSKESARKRRLGAACNMFAKTMPLITSMVRAANGI